MRDTTTTTIQDMNDEVGEDMQEDRTNVFVKYLPPELDDQGLKDLFSLAGEIISAKVMMDLQQCTSLGYGFVRFVLPKHAERAILTFNGYRLGVKTLLCKLSNLAPNGVNSREVSTNLYIKHLPASTSEESLRDLFSKFGPISTVKVMMDKSTGQFLQIGFVQFEKQEDATAALREMHGNQIPHSHRLTVRYAESDKRRAERRAYRQSPPLIIPTSPLPLDQLSPKLFIPTYYTYYAPFLTYYPHIYPPVFSSM